jgi:hypothetical protein
MLQNIYFALRTKNLPTFKYEYLAHKFESGVRHFEWIGVRTRQKKARQARDSGSAVRQQETNEMNLEVYLGGILELC